MIKHERTSVKHELQRAFLDLLSETDYMDITVSALVKKAKVARMSFYRNFNSMEDVIESIANKMVQDFTSSIIPVIEENTERKWREYIFERCYGFIQAQKEYGISMSEFEKKHPRNVFIIMSRVHEKLNKAAQSMPANTIKEKYTAIGKLELINGILRKWAITNMPEPLEDMVDLITSIITKF